MPTFWPHIISELGGVIQFFLIDIILISKKKISQGASNYIPNIPVQKGGSESRNGIVGNTVVVKRGV